MKKLVQNVASIWRNILGDLKRIDCGNDSTKKLTLYVDNRFRLKFSIFFRDLWHIMEGSSSSLHPSLKPPSCVQGMTDLKREKFVKNVKVPGVKIPKREIRNTQRAWKPLLLKLKGLSPIGELASDDPLKDTHSLVLFDPSRVEDEMLSDDIQKILNELGFDPEKRYELELGYKNWTASEILKAVLPKESDGVSSFTQIGHIAHLNLRPENMLFKNVIGQVILDKISSVKTVINKLNTIDNTYRNFEMELLAGENNFVTQTKEHNCVFELDFSKVYWNSRLSTEHQRIVDVIEKGSIVYDVFAGVGPFAIPLAKRKSCTVFANDLNPHSFESLQRNVALNKIKDGLIFTHNVDGREFIKTVVKSHIEKRLIDARSISESEKEKEQKDLGVNFDSQPTSENSSKSSVLENEHTHTKSYVIMNLPALAVDFLDSFDSLLSDIPEDLYDPEFIGHFLPVVYCYAFCAKGENIQEDVIGRANDVLKQPLPPDATVRIVRNVSPNKEMVCLIFKLWTDLVLGRKMQGASKGISNCSGNDSDQEEPSSKKQKTVT